MEDAQGTRKRRRRKRSAREQAEDGAGDPPPADAAAGGGGGGAGGAFSTEGLQREDADLVRYLEEAHAAILEALEEAERRGGDADAGADGDADGDAAVCMATAATREVTRSLVASPSGSRAVEALLALPGEAGRAAAFALIEKVAGGAAAAAAARAGDEEEAEDDGDGGLFRVLCAPCGSFVMQAAFSRLGRGAGAEPAPAPRGGGPPLNDAYDPRAQSCLSLAAAPLLPSLGEAVAHRSASHALRGLVGCVYEIGAPAGAGSLLCTLAERSAAAAAAALGRDRLSSYGVGFFSVLLRKLAQHAGDEEAAAPGHAGAGASAYVRSLGAVVRELLRLHPLARLAKDVAGSHLSECIVECACCSAAARREVFGALVFEPELRGRVLELSRHRRGLFTVRSMLFMTGPAGIGADVLEAVLAELRAHLADLMRMGNGSVVNALMLACRTLGVATRRAARALRKSVMAMDVGEDEDEEEQDVGRSRKHRGLAPRILRLDGLLGGRIDGPATRAGCGLLVTMLKFPAEDARAFSESVGCLSAAQAHELARDSAGCRVLEAFVESECAPAAKAELVRRFDGRFGELALTNHGSFLVGRSFRQVEAPELKERIVRQLSTVRARLERTQRGPTLLAQCGVYEYESDAHGWRVSVRNRDRMVSEFTSMFEDVARRNGAAAADGREEPRRKRGRKKRRGNNRD